MKMWYEREGTDEDVVLSTKACLVRNVKGYNFPSKMDERDAKSLLAKVDSVIDKSVFSGGLATDIVNRGEAETLMKAQISEETARSFTDLTRKQSITTRITASA